MRKLAEFTNGDHDERSIHATYMERLVHVADMLDKYTGTNDHIDWEGLMSEFVGQWYHKEANLKKAATIARAFKNKPLVIFIYFNFLFL